MASALKMTSRVSAMFGGIAMSISILSSSQEQFDFPFYKISDCLLAISVSILFLLLLWRNDDPGSEAKSKQGIQHFIGRVHLGLCALSLRLIERFYVFLVQYSGGYLLVLTIIAGMLLYGIWYALSPFLLI